MTKTIGIAPDNAPIDISVCIPTYNGGKYLAETLRSVEEQDFTGSVEVILSDDTSSDDTVAVSEAAAAASRFPYRLIRNSQRGIGNNWNNCVAAARGKYIKLLMQDDILYPDHLSALFAACERHPTAGLAFARRDVLFDAVTTRAWHETNDNLHEGWDQPIREGLISGRALLKDRNFLRRPRNKIGEPSSVLLRHDAVRATGSFHTGLPQSLDYEFWYRMMVHYDVCFVDRALSAFRRHPEQASAVNHAAGFNKDGKETVVLYRSYIRHLPRFVSLASLYTICKQILRRDLRRLYRGVVPSAKRS